MNSNSRGIVLITGAATGVGLAAAQAVSQSGFRVIAVALPGQDTSELRKISDINIVEADLQQDADIDKLVSNVRGADNLFAIISNAGIAIPGPVECLPIDQVRQQYQVNVFAPISIIQGLLPALRKTKGRIIIIGAGQARAALPFGGAYGSSKAAIAAFADSLRAEVSSHDIKVSVIEPGAIKTGILQSSKDNWATILSQINRDLQDDILQSYKRSMEKQFALSEKAFETAFAPEEFAKIITSVLTKKNPKPRYLIGKESKLLGFVSRLPSRLRAKLMEKMV